MSDITPFSENSPDCCYNPCISCGACCAYFRVSFYWAEGDDAAGTVPTALTEDVPPYLRCMRGTNTHHPYCAALSGTIGSAVSCAIYPSRPSTCRQFMPTGASGERNDACDRARAYYALAPLFPPMAK